VAGDELHPLCGQEGCEELRSSSGGAPDAWLSARSLRHYDTHAFITDRDGETLELEADHRRHAEIENAIRDLKYGVGLNHLPSGKFAANAACSPFR